MSKKIKLGELASVKGGKRLPKGVNLLSTPNSHPYIRVRDLNNRHTLEVTSDFEYVDEKIQKTISRYTVDSGDIVLSIVGTIGLVAIVGDSLHGANLTENCVKITDLSGVDRDYLYYYLKSELGQAEIAKGTVGAVQAKLPIKNIQAINVVLPNLEVQKRIAHLLSAIDNKIELNNKINDNLQQQMQALFRSWFTLFDYSDGVQPSTWEEVTLDTLSTLISRGITPKYADESEQIIVNQKCIRNHTLDLSLARPHLPKSINEKWLRFGDLLINSTGDGTLGRTAQVWFEPNNLTVDSHVTIVRPANINLIFYIGLWGILHEKEIEALHTGSTGQTELPRERVKSIPLLLPDVETLQRFNAVIEPMVAMIVQNQKENKRLASLRDALLPKLMFGEIYVTDIQP